MNNQAKTHEDLIAALEVLVDKHALHNVVEALGEICDLKAEHVESNWQDAILAGAWTRSARDLDKTAARIQARKL